MQGETSSGTTNGQAAHSLLIIVPRTRVDLRRSLTHSFGEDAKVQVIVDRRLGDRRAQGDGHEPERRLGDRRLSSDIEAELRAGRWVAVARPTWQIDLGDPDAKAILFLCCAEHVVPCQTCQNTFRLRWILQGNPENTRCPMCGNDLTPLVVAHVQTCPYWATRKRGAQKPPAKVGLLDTSAEAAAG